MQIHTRLQCRLFRIRLLTRPISPYRLHQLPLDLSNPLLRATLTLDLLDQVLLVVPVAQHIKLRRSLLQQAQGPMALMALRRVQVLSNLPRPVRYTTLVPPRPQVLALLQFSIILTRLRSHQVLTACHHLLPRYHPHHHSYHPRRLPPSSSSNSNNSRHRHLYKIATLR